MGQDLLGRQMKREGKRSFTVLHTEASRGWGGQEIRIFQEALGLTGRGYRVMIATPQDTPLFNRARTRGIPVFPMDFNKRNPLSLLKALRLIQKLKPDILNTHSSSDSWVASMAARLSGRDCKIVRTRHLSTPIGKGRVNRFIYDTLPDAIITTGETIKRQMVEVNRFDPSRIVSIPTGVDLERFDPSRAKPVLKEEGFCIGAIGVLRNWKGHAYLIDAAPRILKEIPEATFYIVGDGPQYGNLLRRIKDLGLEDKVLMLGYREDIPEILASLDVVVHPSYENEGIPQVVLQAMAMERPVVAADSGAIGEVVLDGKTGLLVPPKDPIRLAEKVVGLYRQAELRTALGKEGRRFVRKGHSSHRMLDRLESLYNSLIHPAP